MQTDACTALDWVAGLFFQSGRLLGLIMQAIATVIGADLGGFADEFGACFEESLFTFFHDVPPVFDWVNGLRGNPIRKCIPQICCGRKGICANPGLKRAKSSFLVGEGSMQVFIAEDNYYELERLRRQVQSWGSRYNGIVI